MYQIRLSSLRLSAFVILLLSSIGLRASDDSDVAALRKEIEALKADYQVRISALDARLAAAEREVQVQQANSAAIATLSVAGSAASADSVSAGNDFNPQISLILDGNYHHDDVGGQGADIVGSALQPSQTGEHGHDHVDHADSGNGFSLRETELAFSASVDPYFDAGAYIAIDSNGGVELEEAWFLTRSLPGGLKLKGGKFLSDFGYINRQHPHQWDFVDQNLAHLNLLGDHGLNDTGLQLSWLPDAPLYTLLGVELLQGDQERFGSSVIDEEERAELGLADREDGPRLWTAFIKVAPELGYDHTLQLGASFAHNQHHQEVIAGAEQSLGLEGDADLWGLDLVYQFDHPSLYGYRDLKIQAEYLYSDKRLNETNLPIESMAGGRRLTTDGYYLQTLYGIAPRWQMGIRYDVLGDTNRVRGSIREDYGSSDRVTGVLTWIPSEFSLLRLQYAKSDMLIAPGEREKFDAFWLQFLLSLGSHGAHRF